MAKDFDLKSVLAPVDTIVKRLSRHRAQLQEEIDLIDTQLARFDGLASGTTRAKKVEVEAEDAPAPKRRGKGKRTRRSREEIDAFAQQIVDFIKATGKEGTTGKEIKAKFGKLPPSVNAWLGLYSPVKVKTMGKQSAMRYFI